VTTNRFVTIDALDELVYGKLRSLGAPPDGIVAWTEALPDTMVGDLFHQARTVAQMEVVSRIPDTRVAMWSRDRSKAVLAYHTSTIRADREGIETHYMLISAESVCKQLGGALAWFLGDTTFLTRPASFDEKSPLPRRQWATADLQDQGINAVKKAITALGIDFFFACANVILASDNNAIALFDYDSEQFPVPDIALAFSLLVPRSSRESLTFIIPGFDGFELSQMQPPIRVRFTPSKIPNPGADYFADCRNQRIPPIVPEIDRIIRWKAAAQKDAVGNNSHVPSRDFILNLLQETAPELFGHPLLSPTPPPELKLDWRLITDLLIMFEKVDHSFVRLCVLLENAETQNRTAEYGHSEFFHLPGLARELRSKLGTLERMYQEKFKQPIDSLDNAEKQAYLRLKRSMASVTAKQREQDSGAFPVR